MLKPTTSKASPILKARVVINYTSVVVPLLIANISSAPVTIKKGKMLAVNQPLEQRVSQKNMPNATVKLQSACMVEPSSSTFARLTILISKNDGSLRLCIDYRKLNSVTKKDTHPLPRVENIFDTLAGSKFCTTLDLAME